MAKLGACLVLSAVVLAAPAAYAQDFGKEGQIAVGAERLFGVVHTSVTEEEGDVSVTFSHTNISLLISRSNSSGGGAFPLGYSFPRIAGDYFVIDGLSVGGSLGVYTHSGNLETEGDGVSVEADTGSITGFLFEPRVGYAFMFSDMIGIWPRGGITFLSESSENADNDERSSSSLALTLECPLVINPVPHVVFGIGPTFDLGLTGSNEVNPSEPMAPTSETDLTMHDIGLQASLTAYF
jgi:hypothetical protein